MDLHEARVLVVDDSEDITASLGALLQLNGYTVRMANDGARALELIDEFKPLCVLFDVHMPRLDGLALAQALRQRFGKDVLLIAMSGFSEQDARVSATFDLVDYHFVKPIDFHKLGVIFPPPGH